MNRYYLQAPDGQCLYSVIVDSYQSNLVGATGHTVHLGNSKYAHSVLTDGPVSTITQTTTTYEYHDTYTLIDADLKSKALPLHLSLTAYNGLGESLQEHYRRDVTAGESTRLLDVSNHIALPGDLPTEQPPRNWQPSHWAQIYGPNAAHLVPGSLVGFRAHIKAIGKTYGDCYDHNGPTTMKFGVRSFWEPPRHANSMQGRRVVRSETWVTNSFELTVLDAVGGNTLADALINWQAQTDEIVATLDSYRTTKACGHCDGRGYVAPT